VLDKGENSRLVTLGEDRALVLRVSDHVKPAQKPLEAVRAEVVAKLTEQSAKAAAEKEGQSDVEQLVAGTLQWSALNKKLPASPVGKKLLERNATVDQPLVLKKAFAVSKTEISSDKPAYRGVLLDNGDYAVLTVSSVQSGSAGAPDVIKARISELRTAQEQISGTNDFSAYMHELLRTAKVTTNPAAFE
jgi:peptidyl-prolyl cis-trans isomerase D